MEQEFKRAQEEARANRKARRGVDLDLGVEVHLEDQTRHIMHHNNKIELTETSTAGEGRQVLEMPLDLPPKVTSRTKGEQVDLVRGGKHRI